MGSDLAGLEAREAERRLAACGPNLVTRERKPTVIAELWGRTRNPGFTPLPWLYWPLVAGMLLMS